MKLPLPETMALKEPQDWKLIGTEVRRLDTPEKITGKAQFGIDVTFPDLRTAVVLRPPAFGATLVKFDDSDALKVPGVEKVVQITNGVAVVAKHFWAAKLGRDALRAEWSTPEGGGVSSEKLLAEFRELARREGMTVLWWRSVGNFHTAFAIESMIDELAHAAGKEPLAYRLALLKGKLRFARALETAATQAGWGTPPPAGRARGIAVHEGQGSIIAEVAEVSVENGSIRVHAMTAAVDCGTAVNPLGIEAQVQGSIVFGLSATLYGKLTIEDGKVVESNFHDYPVLRMSETPKIAVHVIRGDAKMGGIGEPATALVAPAVANAVFALTKQRLRTLPLRLA